MQSLDFVTEQVIIARPRNMSHDSDGYIGLYNNLSRS